MRDHAQRRRPLPVRLTPAERDFHVELRRLVDAAGLSFRALEESTSAVRSDSGESSFYSKSQWGRWLNGQSHPPRKAVRKLAAKLGEEDIDAGHLVDLWDRAFVAVRYPQEPAATAATAPDHRQTQIVSPPPGFSGPVPAASAAEVVLPVTRAASSPAYSAAGQARARPDASPAAPPGGGGQRVTPSPRDDHLHAAAGGPGPGEKTPREARPGRAIWPGGFRPVAAAGVIVVVTAACLVAVWRSSHRADPEGFAGFAISVAGIAAGWIAWIWRHNRSRGSGVVSGQELGRLADLLAGAVEAEWTRAAGERGLLEPEPIPVRWQRPAAPFTGPAAAAVASTRFAPLPGLAAAGERQLQAGQVSELHEVYGGLGSGRLVIAGGPGSGKSSAAVLLILAALRHRRSVPDAGPAAGAGAGDVHLARVGPRHPARPGLAG